MLPILGWIFGSSNLNQGGCLDFAAVNIYIRVTAAYPKIVIVDNKNAVICTKNYSFNQSKSILCPNLQFYKT